MLLFLWLFFFCFPNTLCFASKTKNNNILKKSFNSDLPILKNLKEEYNQASVTEKNNGSFNDHKFLQLVEPLAIYYGHENATKTLADVQSCSNQFFPHGIYIEGSTPKVQCGSLRCLKSMKIQCEKNVALNKCMGCKKWIAGFTNSKNGDLQVECCQYIDLAFTMFSKQISFTKTLNYTSSILVKNKKLYAFQFFNNITMVKTKNNGILYTASIYQMSCPFDPKLNDSQPNIDNPLIAQFDANYLAAQIYGLEARARTNYTSLLPHSKSNKYDLSTILHHYHSGLSNEVAVFSAAVSRYMASQKIKKNPYAYLYNHLTLEYAINLLPTLSRDQKTQTKNFSFPEMFAYYSSQFPKNPYYC